MKANGVISAIQGQVARVTFYGKRPARNEILKVVGMDDVILEVASSVTPDTFFCFVLTPHNQLSRGLEVRSTGSSLSVPVGPAVLGRAFDIFGYPHDKLEPIESELRRPLFGDNQRQLKDIVTPTEVIETGIKPIDFFTPIYKGGKTALVGGAGVGKTVVLTAIMNRLAIQKKSKANEIIVFAAVGERSREAQELYKDLKETGTLPITSLVLGQMGENPALRFRTAYAGATIAEHFRDERKNVLFFMDNMFRFAQAGHELSTLMGLIPSEDGYQPTMSSEVAGLTERLISTHDASISSFLAIFVPSDDLTDYAVRSLFPYLDSMVILSRDVAQTGRYPAIDLLQSVSSALNPLSLGAEHYNAYIKAKQLMETATSLERIVSLVGETELSEDNRKIYKRSQMIVNFMTQDLFVGSTITEDTTAHIPASVTVQEVKNIIEGKYDELDPEDFLYAGDLSELKKKEPAQRKPVPDSETRVKSPV